MRTREQIDILVKLQQIDSEINVVNQTLGRVESTLALLDKELSDFGSTLEKQDSDLEELKKAYRGFELDVNSNLPKIEKSKERLAAVKSNKEYQSLLKEIDDLKAINSDLEDRMLECLEQIDQAEQDFKKRQTEFIELEDRIQTEKDKIAQDAADGNKRLAELNEQWQGVLDTVEPGVMATFKKVRGRVGNLTIAKVEKEVCKGCNVNIPPQMYNELQRCEKLMFCPHCQRIIYSKNTS
jgi:predicted  nucleic acid-binding Zn-ribbon protein